MEKVKVIVRNIPKGKNHEAFTAYQLVTDGGRLVDLRMCKTVDTKLFDGMKKFYVDAEVEDASARYEYPRYYMKAIDPDSIMKIS